MYPTHAYIGACLYAVRLSLTPKRVLVPGCPIGSSQMSEYESGKGLESQHEKFASCWLLQRCLLLSHALSCLVQCGSEASAKLRPWQHREHPQRAVGDVDKPVEPSLSPVFSWRSTFLVWTTINSVVQVPRVRAYDVSP
jgi:hypothetical protein